MNLGWYKSLPRYELGIDQVAAGVYFVANG